MDVNRQLSPRPTDEFSSLNGRVLTVIICNRDSSLQTGQTGVVIRDRSRPGGARPGLLGWIVL